MLVLTVVARDDLIDVSGEENPVRFPGLGVLGVRLVHEVG